MKIEEQRYAQVWAQLVFHQTGTRTSFNSFVQLATAVIGGSIWLSLQDGLQTSSARQFGTLTNILMVAIALLACVQIGTHMRAWWKMRGFVVDLHDHHALPLAGSKPHWRSQIFDYAMLSAVALVAIGFCFFNPFDIIVRTT